MRIYIGSTQKVADFSEKNITAWNDRLARSTEWRAIRDSF